MSDHSNKTSIPASLRVTTSSSSGQEVQHVREQASTLAQVCLDLLEPSGMTSPAGSVLVTQPSQTPSALSPSDSRQTLPPTMPGLPALHVFETPPTQETGLNDMGPLMDAGGNSYHNTSGSWTYMEIADAMDNSLSTPNRFDIGTPRGSEASGSRRRKALADSPSSNKRTSSAGRPLVANIRGRASARVASPRIALSVGTKSRSVASSVTSSRAASEIKILKAQLKENPTPSTRSRPDE